MTPTTTQTQTQKTTTSTPTWAERLCVRAALIDPAAVQRGLDEIAAARGGHPAIDGRLPPTLPSLFQIAQGVWRVQHRVLFRSETFGLSSHPVRPNLRARVLQHRALRLPFLLQHGSVQPLDLSGLRQSPSSLARHVLGTHHEGRQPIYDLEILAARAPSALLRLREELCRIIDGTHPNAELLRDLCVYERYHEELLPLVDEVLGGGFADDDDPDLGFFAWLRFCARQPRDLDGLRRAAAAGRWSSVGGVVDDEDENDEDEDDDDDRAALTLADLLAADRAGLRRAFARGTPVPASSLAGRRCRGVSLGLPRVVERLTWKLFAKDIVRDADGGLRGENVGVDQPAASDAATLLSAPLVERRRYAPFRVRDDDDGAVIDYGVAHDPLRRVGDNLLLGVTVVLGQTTPTWFALVPEDPVSS